VTYLVSGGGAAKPVEVERKPEDLYQDTGFPNYHFVEFVLNGDTVEGKSIVSPTPRPIFPRGK
jgi:acid phosphatase type 7